MDQVLADTLTANLRSAKSEEERDKAQTLALIALVDCQRKTSDRVKELHSAHERKLWLGRIVQGCASAGGFALLVKVMKLVDFM